MFKRSAIQKKFGRILKNVVKELSKRITIITTRRDQECPNCFFDSTSGKSSGVCKRPEGHSDYFKYGRCPTCGGKGTIDIKIKKFINASIVWKGATSAVAEENELAFNEWGLQGYSVARLKTDICNLEKIENCDNIVIDGISYVVYTPSVVDGLGGKHILVVYVRSAEKNKNLMSLKPTSAF